MERMRVIYKLSSIISARELFVGNHSALIGASLVNN